MALETTHRYDDIINLPHHVSRRHPPMSRHNRAAQFMPFAAVAGYDQVVAETARSNNHDMAVADTPVDGLAEGWVPA